MEIRYDDSHPLSIESYAKALKNKRFRDILPEDKVKELNKNHKGGLGTLLEKYFFGYEPNSEAGPDFPKAGVELKVTPYKKNKTKKFSAKERLVLNLIDYEKIIEENFEESSFWRKNKLLLLIFYLYEDDVDRLDYLMTHIQLFQFPEKDLKIIKDDWKKIKEKVLAGKAHEISESDTNYLAACTKGANKNSLRKQPNSPLMAKQRAFSLKSSYMTYILNEYINKGVPTYVHEESAPYYYEGRIDKKEEIADDFGEKTLEEYIIDKFKKYYGKTLNELIAMFGLEEKRKSKHITYLVASKIVNKNLTDLRKAEEFQKANIKVKAIRINKNGKINEHMSFPTFKYTEIIKEDWEHSSLRNMFLDTKYLFIVYKENSNRELVLEKTIFWNMPLSDLDNEVRIVWEETVKRIKEGRAHDLPKISEYDICHVRPHARNSSDTYPTPYGTEEVKKCFWLNNSYILEQINKNNNY